MDCQLPVAPPHERSDLSGHYSVCALVCLLLGWLLVATEPHSPTYVVGNDWIWIRTLESLLSRNGVEFLELK